MDFHYEEGAGGPHAPVVRNITVQDVTCKTAKYALYLRGFESSPIRDVHLSNCTFERVSQPNVIENVRGLSTRDVTVEGRPLRF